MLGAEAKTSRRVEFKSARLNSFPGSAWYSVRVEAEGLRWGGPRAVCPDQGQSWPSRRVAGGAGGPRPPLRCATSQPRKWGLSSPEEDFSRNLPGEPHLPETGSDQAELWKSTCSLTSQVKRKNTGITNRQKQSDEDRRCFKANQNCCNKGKEIPCRTRPDSQYNQ